MSPATRLTSNVSNGGTVLQVKSVFPETFLNFMKQIRDDKHLMKYKATGEWDISGNPNCTGTPLIAQATKLSGWSLSYKYQLPHLADNMVPLRF